MNISIKKKWSKKYKAKINCKNPKGFSQKQYCKYGRKKMKGGGGKRKTNRKKSKIRNTRRKMKGGGGTFSRVSPDNTYVRHTDSTGAVSTIIPRNSVSPEPQKRYIYFTFSKMRFSNKYKAEEVTIEQLKLGDWRLPNLYHKEDILVLLNELKDHYQEINRVTEEGGRYLDERYLEYRFPFYTYNERPIYQDYNQSKHTLLKIDAMINYFNNTEDLPYAESQIMNRVQQGTVARYGGGKKKRRTRRKRIK